MHRFYPWADAWVAVSADVADEVARMAGIPRDRIEVIANPVVCPELFQLAAAPLDHEWFAPHQPPVILGVGRMVAQKKFGTLLEAFAQLRIPARLVVLGDGPERAPLVARAKELGLDSRVSFPGFVDNPYPYMARASIVVLPSAYEAFGLVLVEALALGTPVISTDTAGGREILGDGHGQLVPVGDIARLAAAIHSVIGASKPPVAEDLGRYTVASVVGEYQRIICNSMNPIRVH
jgi:glycosyltransferase involved in cell wall biosynthesis